MQERNDSPPLNENASTPAAEDGGAATKETSVKQENPATAEEGFSATPTIKTVPVSNPEDEKVDDAASQVSGATKEELKELTQRNREAKPKDEKLS